MTVDDARRLVAEGVALRTDLAALAGLVADIDWSHAEMADSEVTRIVGGVEGVVTLLCEGDISTRGAEEALLALLDSPLGLGAGSSRATP